MRSLYTLPHDAERDTYLVLNDFRDESVAPGQTNHKAPAATTARGFRSVASTLLNDEASATGKQKAAVRLRLAFA
jgi:hypothetical protein